MSGCQSVVTQLGLFRARVIVAICVLITKLEV